MPDVTSPRVGAYLDELDRALRDLPRDRRREILQDIREHIDDALAGVEQPSEATVAEILDGLGTPQEIADAAYAESPPGRTRIAGRDVVTVLLLLAGGIVLPLIGWAIGVVLLWTSTSWTTRDKTIGTLVVPGGLLATLLGAGFSLFAVTSTSECLGPATAAGATWSSCTSSGPGVLSHIVVAVVLIFLVVGPFFSMAWLIRHARRVA